MRSKPLRGFGSTPSAPPHVHVAGQGRLDGAQRNLARRGHVDDRRGQARGERVQQVLGGIGARVGAEEDRGLARVELERLDARAVLPAGGVEALDRRALCAPSIQRFVARNWNRASSGWALIRSSVANICSVSTPLRVDWVTVVIWVLRGGWRCGHKAPSAPPAPHRRHHPTARERRGGIHVRSSR